MYPNKICRLCLNTCTKYESLYDNNGLVTQVYELTFKYFDSTILNMELGKGFTVICSICWCHMLDFTNFARNVVIIQKKLNLGEVDKSEEVFVISEEDSMDETNLVENEEEFISLPETTFNRAELDTNDMTHTDDIPPDASSNDYVSHDDILIPSNNDFADLCTVSMGTDFANEDVKMNISVPELELIDVHSGGELSSGDEELPLYKSESTPGTSSDGFLIKDVNSLWQGKNSNNYNDITAQLNSILVCTLCEERCSCYSELCAHFQKHPNEQCYISCCGINFFSESLFEEHILLHNNPNTFKCKICINVYATSQELMEHSLSQHSEHKCTECEKTFPTKARRILHERIGHEKGRIKTESSDHACKKYLLEHEDNRDSSSDSTTTYIINSHDKTADILPHVADTHSKDNIYMCLDCPKKYPDLHSLKCHQKGEHQTLRLYHCPHCPTKCKTHRILKNHVEKLHRGERFHPCSLCPLSFAHKSSLRHHQNTKHSKEIDEKNTVGEI